MVAAELLACGHDGGGVVCAMVLLGACGSASVCRFAALPPHVCIEQCAQSLATGLKSSAAGT